MRSSMVLNGLAAFSWLCASYLLSSIWSWAPSLGETPRYQKKTGSGELSPHREKTGKERENRRRRGGEDPPKGSFFVGLCRRVVDGAIIDFLNALKEPDHEALFWRDDKLPWLRRIRGCLKLRAGHESTAAKRAGERRRP